MTPQRPSDMDCRDWALFYYDQGLAVLPGEEWSALRALPEDMPEDEREKKFKHPVVAWKPYQKEKPSREQVEAWFPPGVERNVLLVLGEPSGNLAVLDFDGEFYEAHAKGAERTTWVSKTDGLGHRHVYIRFKKPAQSLRVFYNGKIVLEVLAEDRVVVAPPSLHLDGGHYEWLADVKALSIAEHEDPASFLDILLSRMDIKPYEPEACMKVVAEELRGRPYEGEDPPCIKRLLKGVEEGRRNESAIRLAWYLLRLKQLSPEEALSRLHEWNRHNKPPLPEGEVDYAVKSVAKGLYPYGCRSLKELDFCLPQDKRACPLRPEFEIVSLKQLVEEAMPIQYLCEPLLPKGALVLLAGKAGVGKSLLGLHIAYAVASSSKVFGRFDVAEGSRVLIIDEENSPSVYRGRVQAMGLNSLENIDCLSLSGFKLDNPKHLKFLERTIASNGYGLVILDNWTDLVFKVDENKAVEVSNVLSVLRRMAYERGCVIILIHHLRKNLPYVVNEIDELRGSSALVNEPDLVLLIQKDEATGQRIIKTVKARYGGELAFRLAFETEGGRLNIRWIGEAERGEVEPDIMSCARFIVGYLAQKGTAKRAEIVNAARAAGYSRSTVDRALLYLLATSAAERIKRGIYQLKSSAPPNFSVSSAVYSTEKMEKSEACAVCGRPGGKPHATDKGVVYLHDECMGKYEGKL